MLLVRRDGYRRQSSTRSECLRSVDPLILGLTLHSALSITGKPRQTSGIQSISSSISLKRCEGWQRSLFHSIHPFHTSSYSA